MSKAGEGLGQPQIPPVLFRACLLLVPAYSPTASPGSSPRGNALANDLSFSATSRVIASFPDRLLLFRSVTPWPSPNSPTKCHLSCPDRLRQGHRHTLPPHPTLTPSFTLMALSCIPWSIRLCQTIGAVDCGHSCCVPVPSAVSADSRPTVTP